MKSAIKYQISNTMKVVAIYYAVIVTLAIIGISITSIVGNVKVDDASSSSTIVLLFIIGLAMFKDNFYFFQQNSVSRKTQIYSFAVTTLAVSAILAVIDMSIAGVVFNLFNGIGSVFQLLTRYLNVSEFMKYVYIFIWQFFMYLICIMTGFFISISYYRMSKWIKVVVSVGVPLGFIALLSFLAREIDLSGLVSKIFFTVIGIDNLLVGVGCLLSISGLLFLFNYLSIKRVVIK